MARAFPATTSGISEILKRNGRAAAAKKRFGQPMLAKTSFLPAGPVVSQIGLMESVTAWLPFKPVCNTTGAVAADIGALASAFCAAFLFGFAGWSMFTHPPGDASLLRLLLGSTVGHTRCETRAIERIDPSIANGCETRRRGDACTPLQHPQRSARRQRARARADSAVVGARKARQAHANSTPVAASAARTRIRKSRSH